MAPEPGFLKCGADPKAKAFFDADTGEWFTRAQLSSRVTAFADRLRFPAKALGFHFALNDGDSLVAYLAAIEAGHAVVMLNPELDAVLKSRLIALFRPDFVIAPISHPPEGIRPDGPEYSVSTSPHAGPTAVALLRAATVSYPPRSHAIDIDLRVDGISQAGPPLMAKSGE